MTDMDLGSIKQRLEASTGGEWAADPNDANSIMIEIAGGQPKRLTATRDAEPARPGDVRLIANLKHDISLLVEAEASHDIVALHELDGIRKRLQEASPGPWMPFLESDGGHGGDSVIWVTVADGPDLYLWIDGKPAPDADFRFVGQGRQDLEALLRAASRRSISS